MVNSYIRIVAFMMWSSFSIASTVGTISGTVIDEKSGTPLPGVNVMIPSLNIGTASDLDGDYYIQNIPVGLYSIEVGMIGYTKVTVNDVRVIMDQTMRINFSLQEQVIEGQEITVTAERPLVEKDVTVKKMVRTAEEIKNLPARNLTEMLTLESGIIQVKSAEYGIPGFEDRGIEEIHVRGGRSGEIGYTIDGMYIENPIYGGLGKGTRLNSHAVQEFIVQTGVFSAEYGDAMSSIVNNITMTGGDKYQGSFEWQTSNLGPLSAEQDRLRDYNKYAGSLSGPIFPNSKALTFHVSADYTSSAYRVLKFDDVVYIENDPGNRTNLENKVHFLDREAGWRSFGYDRTFDIFTKLQWQLGPYKQINFSHWYVNSDYKTYGRWNQFYEDGKNVSRKWSSRYHLEFRHTLSEKTYYTLSASRFTQQMEMNVENGDMDGDGYPDWVEYRKGTEARGLHQGVDYKGECDIPFDGGEIYGPGSAPIINESAFPKYLEAWGLGCLQVQVEYYERATLTAPYDAYYLVELDLGEQLEIRPWDKVVVRNKFSFKNAQNQTINRSNGQLIDPLDSLEYKDKNGVTHMWHLGDPMDEYLAEGQYTPRNWMFYPDSTWDLYSNPINMTGDQIKAVRDSLYYLFYYYEFGSQGADWYRHWTKSVTDEVKFDLTSRVNKHHQLRGGIDLKRHLITFDETQGPYLESPYVETYGLPGTVERDNKLEEILYGTGEKTPVELGIYLQDKVEYPWMTINMGVRFDIQNSLDSSWADPRRSVSGNVPTDWSYLWSPRLGISHVITDKATFTFGYGRYYQNLTYRNIYLNDDNDLTTGSPILGNSHVQAQSVSSYEFGVNWEFIDFWRLGVVGWSKDYSDLASTERVDAFPYSYSVVVNYDYASARGLDVSLTKRGGGAWSTVIQYTLSRATANRADPWQGYRNSDTPESMPKKEVLMNYDRTHNMTITGGYRFNQKNSPKIFGYSPLNKATIHLTMVAISGAPYTPFDINLNRPGATNSERMPWYVETNLAARKHFAVYGTTWSAGLIVRNIFNRLNVIDIYEETGSAVDPGRNATDAIERGQSSLTVYDRPYYYSDPRKIDLTLEFSF